jgi:low temperature requirement protein LtrA
MTGDRQHGHLLLRRGGYEHGRVAFVELFFDFVFVFAITQLSHLLLANFTLLLMAVW